MKKRVKSLLKKIIRKLIWIFRGHGPAMVKAGRFITKEAQAVGREKKKGSKASARPGIDELCLELSQFDVVSFDMFDTLIFRVFPDPKMIFDLWGAYFNVQYGRKIRAEAERKLRAGHGSREITLGEIYDIVSVHSGIDKETGMQKELDLELEYCIPNEYMQEVVKRLRAMGKTVIILTDMYMPKAQIERMLKKCGYTDYDGLYVSCEYGKTKASGELYEVIAEKYGRDKSYVQVGDNRLSDIENAAKMGWTGYHYKNVHALGNPNGPDGMSSIGGGLYRGIVNPFLYSGCEKRDKYYDLGFVHFGLFVYGYCAWLNRLARERGADMILFASRDMDVVQKVYNECFGQVENHYIRVSRLACMRADFARSSEMFLTCLRDACEHNENLTVGGYFSPIKFDFLLPLIEKAGISRDDVMDSATVEKLKQLIIENKAFILQNLEPDHEAAMAYYAKLLEGKDHVKTILFADLNGRCTSTLAVHHIIEDTGRKVKMIGAQAYSISNRGFVEMKISDSTLDTFVFSYLKNRSFYDDFRINGIDRTRVMEEVFCDDTGSLHSYIRTGDGTLTFGKTPANRERRAAIHKGIIDFAGKYHEYAMRITPEFCVTPYDAWMPVEQIIDGIPNEYPTMMNDMTLGN